MAPLTPTERRVVNNLATAGALTSRHVTTTYGPRPNWHRLLQRGIIREVHTVYGSVLGLTPDTWQKAMSVNRPQTPYLQGPTSLADRAYQMDALRLLKLEGYTLSRHEYKGSGGVGRRGGTTDQITRTVLHVPPSTAAHLAEDWGQVVAPTWDSTLLQWPEVLGHPSLYATISGGGLTPAGLRRLYRRHHLHIHDWRHPMIVAVPDDRPHRAYVRALEARYQAADAESRSSPQPYPLIRLVVLPFPQK